MKLILVTMSLLIFIQKVAFCSQLNDLSRSIEEFNLIGGKRCYFAKLEPFEILEKKKYYDDGVFLDKKTLFKVKASSLNCRTKPGGRYIIKGYSRNSIVKPDTTVKPSYVNNANFPRTKWFKTTDGCYISCSRSLISLHSKPKPKPQPKPKPPTYIPSHVLKNYFFYGKSRTSKIKLKVKAGGLNCRKKPNGRKVIDIYGRNETITVNENAKFHYIISSSSRRKSIWVKTSKGCYISSRKTLVALKTTAPTTPITTTPITTTPTTPTTPINNKLKLHISAYHKPRNREPQVIWNECTTKGITGNYYSSNFGRSGNSSCKKRAVSRDFAYFINSHFSDCVNSAASASHLKTPIKNIHIKHVGITGDSNHSSRSLHSVRRAMDIKSIKITTQKGDKKEFLVYDGYRKRNNASTFYNSFRRCWSLKMQKHNKCSRSKYAGSISWEDRNHRSHLHLSMPYCPRNIGPNRNRYYQK